MKRILLIACVSAWIFSACNSTSNDQENNSGLGAGDGTDTMTESLPTDTAGAMIPEPVDTLRDSTMR